MQMIATATLSEDRLQPDRIVLHSPNAYANASVKRMPEPLYYYDIHCIRLTSISN